MKCICCLSNKILPRPIGLDGYYGCLNCGFVFTGMDKRGDDRGNLVTHYQNVDPHETVAKYKQSFFISALRYLSSRCHKKKKTILDVGCGYGYFLDLAARKGWDTSGIEVVSDAVGAAERRIGKGNIFHGTLKEARYPDNSFDAISLWDVLFIVENPFEELRECYRILKEGGVIGIRVRNVFFQKVVYQVYSPLKKIASRLGLRNPSVFHPFCFSRKALFQLLRRVGFSYIQITNSPLTEGDPYWYTDIKVLTKVAKRLTGLVSGLVFWMSGGSMVIGPSILVWVEKPQSKMKSKRVKPRG